MSQLRYVEAGTRLPPLSMTIFDRHTSLLYRHTLLLARGLDPGFENYAEGPNVHTDDSAAKAAGLPGRIAAGYHGYALLTRALSLFFGAGWTIGGRISVKFIRPLSVGETVTCGGVVKRTVPSEKPHERLAELEVWCQNPRGDITTTGSAWARVSRTRGNTNL